MIVWFVFISPVAVVFVWEWIGQEHASGEEVGFLEGGIGILVVFYKSSLNSSMLCCCFKVLYVRR